MPQSTYPIRGAQRIRVGSSTAVARVTLTDQDDSPTDAAGTVTADIVRADGTVLADGRATTNDPAVGVYSVTLTASECATLDVLTVTWLDGAVVRATTNHRIVGGFLFRPDELAAMSGMSSIAPAQILQARDWITDLIEDATGVSWCPSYDIETFDVAHPSTVRVLAKHPLRSLRSLTVGDNDTVVDVADVDIEASIGRLSDVTFWGQCTAGFEHGFDAPPADLRAAALESARDHVLRKSSGLSDRTRAVTNDLGVTQQFSYAGKNHPTGIDSVDAVIVAHDRRGPGMA